MKVIEMDIECKSCGGTGVYVGFSERKGAGVVCRTCKGTGCQKYKFEYSPFTGRKRRKGVSRVYLSNYDHVIAPDFVKFENGLTVDMDNEGVSYDEFFNGKMPKHIEKLVCPLWAEQEACHEIPGFTEECERLHDGSMLGIQISGCRYKKHCAECWKRFKEASE